MNQEQPPAISVRHLSQRYGKMTVLHDVSFDVQHGEIFGFIGPNGAGKTTTIRTMATLIEPFTGSIHIGGIDVVQEPEAARRLIGYMPDHAGVYERVTVAEYLDFFARSFGVKDETVVEAVVELTDLGQLVNRLVVSLSKGMRQRLQLARVLLHDPQILILDEPASDLDPRARIEIRDLLLELQELGKTIFLSSHILTELSDVCTSVGIIEQGRLLVAGPINTLAEQLARANLDATAQAQLGAITAPLVYPEPANVAPPAAFDPASSNDEAPDGTDARPGAEARTGTETSEPTTQGAPSPEANLVRSASEPAPAAHPVTAIPGAGPETTPAGVVVPASTQRRLKLRVLGSPELARPLLEACPPIRQVDALPGGQLVVRYVADERFVAELVRYLVYNGIQLVAVEPERNELERIFLEVTRGHVQ